jgi:hypothetical protein
MCYPIIDALAAVVICDNIFKPDVVTSMTLVLGYWVRLMQNPLVPSQQYLFYYDSLPL